MMRILSYQSEVVGDKVSLTDGQRSITTDSIDEVFEWMRGAKNGIYNFTWDLETFMRPIIGILPEESRLELEKSKRIFVHDYYFIYNKGKGITIGKGKNDPGIFRCYHLCQYFPDEAEQDYDLPTVVLKAQQLYDELASIGIHAPSFSSPISIFEDSIYKLHMPNDSMMPEGACEMALICSRRSWTEAVRIGHFPEGTWYYDQRSAYPSAMQGLLDCRAEYGDWIQSAKEPKGSVYGFAQGEVKVTSELSPVIYKDIYSKQSNPKDEWPTCISKCLLDCIRELGIGDMAIRDGWWWIPKRRILPVQKYIYSMYSKRARSPTLNWVIKKAINGFYGKLLQTFDDGVPTTKLYNPVWAAIIEDIIKVKDAKFIYSNKIQANVIVVAQDAVMTDKPVDLPPETHKMGEWRLDDSSPALVVSSTVVFHGKKRPLGFTYDEAVKAIQEKPNDVMWTKRNGHGERAFYLQTNPMQHDRHFDKIPGCGAELLANQYRSRAYEVSELAQGDNVLKTHEGGVLE